MTGVWRVYATWRATPSTPSEETCSDHPDWPTARRQARQLACLRGTRYVSVQDPDDVVRGGWDYCTNRWRDYPNPIVTERTRA